MLSTLPLNRGRRGASNFAIDSCSYHLRSRQLAPQKLPATFNPTSIHFDGLSIMIWLALVGKARQGRSNVNHRKCYEMMRVFTGPGFKKLGTLIQWIGHPEWRPQTYAFISNKQ